MCLINFSRKPSEEPDVLVPARPISLPHPRPISTQSQPHPQIRSSTTNHNLNPPAIALQLQPVRPSSSSNHPTTYIISNHHSQSSLPRSPSRPHSQTRPPASISPHQPRTSQVIVIQQRSPRTSGGNLPIHDGSAAYQNGSLAVRRTPSNAAPRTHVYRRSGSVGRQGGAGSQQVQRRSVSGSLYGKDPRMSNASWRSTRERVVVVDGEGARREYWR